MLVVLATAVVAAETTLAFASGPVIWMQAGRADFLQGEPISTAITDAGELRLPPELDAVFDSDEPSIWSVVAASDGTVYVGAGDEGQVFRVSATGESDLFFDSGEVSAQALAWGPDDHLYVATGPRGAVYRLAPSYQHDSNAGTGTSPWFDPGAEYIWDLAFDRAGRLFVATGTEGKIFRVESNTSGGAGELFYDSTERHTTALAIDLDGSLIVGTEDGGQVYRLDESGDVFVLFRFALRRDHLAGGSRRWRLRWRFRRLGCGGGWREPSGVRSGGIWSATRGRHFVHTRLDCRESVRFDFGRRERCCRRGVPRASRRLRGGSCCRATATASTRCSRELTALWPEPAPTAESYE